MIIMNNLSTRVQWLFTNLSSKEKKDALTSEIRSDQKKNCILETWLLWDKICPNRVTMFEEIYFLMKMING